MSFGVMAPVVHEEVAHAIKPNTLGPPFDISRWRAGAYRIPVGSTLTGITFQVNNDRAGAQLRQLSGATYTAQTVAAGNWYTLPPAVFSYQVLVLTGTPAPAADQAVVLSGVDGPATWRKIAAPIAAGAAPTIAVSLEGATAGSYYVPVGFTPTTVTFEVGGGPGQLTPIKDAAGANIVQTLAADRTYTLPAEVFGAPYLRIVGGATWVAGGVIDIYLKQLG